VEKIQKPKRTTLKIHLTALSYREIKKTLIDNEKVSYIDVTKIITESFGDNDLSDIQYWILNQMIVKKIESFKTTNTNRIFITIKDPSKGSVKSFKELLSEAKLSPAQVEIYSI
jgi:hypothetical protein